MCSLSVSLSLSLSLSLCAQVFVVDNKTEGTVTKDKRTLMAGDPGWREGMIPAVSAFVLCWHAVSVQ